jgi:serine/threonine protein kinase
MTLSIGEVVENRYRIAKLLGQGGMGAVYRAWDVRLNRPVALKEMIPQLGLGAEALGDLREQFRQEAQVLATLDHPNLVRVTDYFSWEGNEYLVMDFVEGESLADRIARDGAQPEGQVLMWAGQLLDALAYCHEHGVIHRDIKPQNIIITPEGRVELVDFGLVKLWDASDPHTRTVMRGAGTPEYAPPEQYDMGLGHTDPRSDIYSLGATLYHTLTGGVPPTATQRMASPASFVPPRRINAAVSVNTETVVLKAMAMAMDQRYQNARDMARALGVVQRTLVVGPAEVAPVVTPAVAVAGAAPIAKKRGGLLWGMGGLSLAAVGGVCLVLATVAVLLGTGVLGGSPEPTEAPTRQPTATSHPTATSQPPTDTPPPTETMLPSIPTFIPTTAPLPTPEVFPISSVLFYDDFGSPASGWEVGESSSGVVGYEDGAYIVRGEVINKAVAGVANRSFRDVIVDVDATQVLAPADNDNAYGVMCRVQPGEDGYGFLISGDGYYSIWVVVDGDWEELVEWEASDMVAQGNATNHIRAVCDGSRLALMVNGELLAEAEDTTYVEGDIAVVAATFADETTEIHFDNLSVHDPGAVVLEDDFSDPASGWALKTWDGGSAGYGDGVYVLRAEDKAYYYYGWAGLSLGDVEVEVDATQVLGPANDRNSYGVGCRVQSGGEGYFLRIRGNGEYSIFREGGGEGEDAWLKNWTASAAINRGNATNHLRVICSGDYLALFVNGVLLAEARDDTYTEGDIALAASTFEEEPTEIHFDNLTAYAP